MGWQDGSRFVTPEAVELDLDVAGLGSRFVALAVDSLILGVVTVLVALVAVFGAGALESGLAGIILLSALVLFLTVGYFALFEGLWEGRTPGKRAASIRVIQDDGRPVGGSAVLVRNLLRLVDMLPVFYAIGSVSILVTKRAQRLGDLAAGTIVVHDRDRAAPLPAAVVDAPDWAPSLDTAALTEQDQALVRSFLQRRWRLDTEARARLAYEIARTIRQRVHGVPEGASNEQVIEATAAAVRLRSRSP